jgi:hypothetical protein
VSSPQGQSGFWRLTKGKAQALLFAGIMLLGLDASQVVRATVIDNFESAGSPSPWIFTNGPEYPGATGSLTRAPGYVGSGARLTYDTTKGGNYVGATYNLPAPITAQGLSLWVKHPGGDSVQIRIVDSTGQTLEYCPNRPFDALDPSQWYHLIVRLGQSDLHWGGLNDGIVHNPISALSVLASPALNATGELDFDQVDALPKLPLPVDPATKAIPTGVPDLDASAGVEMEHVELLPKRYDLAQDLGFKWVRTEMFWTDVESKRGVYDFAYYDQVTRMLAKRGMRPEFILCYGNPLYTRENWLLPPLTASAIQGFAKFAHAAAAHFAGQGLKYEIWNEPNIAIFWPDPSATAYAALAKATIPQIHAGDPEAQVSTGGLAGIDLGFLHRLFPAGGAVGSDAIALHPYRIQEPELLSGDFAETSSHLATTVPANPTTIWSTEAGYSSAWYGAGRAAANRTTQAIYGARQILTAAALGIPFQVVFALHDHETDFTNPMDNFGVYTNAYKKKPLTSAVHTLLSQCAGMAFLGLLPSPEVSLHILKFQDANHVLLVLWSDAFSSAGEQVTLKDTPAAAMDYLGNPLGFVAGADSSATIHIGSTPVYVSFL